MKKVLIYGYGNPGRQDDELGILVTSRMEDWAKENGVTSMNFDSNYQLNIEDAFTISEYDMVVFVDASIEEIQDFSLTKLPPNQKTEFTMHAISPGFVLHLCQSLYRKFPEAYLLHIKGYEFGFLEPMTNQAKENLEKSMNFLIDSFSKAALPRQVFDQFIQDAEVTVNISSS